MAAYPESNKLRVFICHASGDKPDALVLFDLLRMVGVEPWLDVKSLPVSIEWEPGIERAIHESDACVVLLSKGSVTKEGYLQREIKLVLKYADYMTEEGGFVAPLKLEECDVPHALAKYQYGLRFEQLVESFTARAKTRGRSQVKLAKSKRFKELRVTLRQIAQPEPVSITKLPGLSKKSFIGGSLLLICSVAGFLGWQYRSAVLPNVAAVKNVEATDDNKRLISGTLAGLSGAPILGKVKITVRDSLTNAIVTESETTGGFFGIAVPSGYTDEDSFIVAFSQVGRTPTVLTNIKAGSKVNVNMR